MHPSHPPPPRLTGCSRLAGRGVPPAQQGPRRPGDIARLCGASLRQHPRCGDTGGRRRRPRPRSISCPHHLLSRPSPRSTCTAHALGWSKGSSRPHGKALPDHLSPRSRRRCTCSNEATAVARRRRRALRPACPAQPASACPPRRQARARRPPEKRNSGACPPPPPPP